METDFAKATNTSLLRVLRVGWNESEMSGRSKLYNLPLFPLFSMSVDLLVVMEIKFQTTLLTPELSNRSL